MYTLNNKLGAPFSLLNLIDPDEFGGFVATNFGGPPDGSPRGAKKVFKFKQIMAFIWYSYGIL